MSRTIQLTYGAAFAARDVLQRGLKQIDDIYVGGRLSLKIKGAAKLPVLEKSEDASTYEDRVNAWAAQKYPEFEADENEIEVFRNAMRSLSAEKALRSSEQMVELIEVFELYKK